MRVSFVKIKKSYISPNEMIRSEERLVPKYILINNIDKFYSFKELKKWINSLKYQDEEYFSCHYIIDKFGKVYNIIPVNEVSYHTKNIKINEESIGIAVLSENGKFNKYQKSALKILLNKHKNIPAYIYSDKICSSNMYYYSSHPADLVL